MVDSSSDQEIRQASLKGEYFREEIWYYRKGDLVIGVTKSYSRCPLQSWNQVGKLLGVRSTCMPSKVGSLSRRWSYMRK